MDQFDHIHLSIRRQTADHFVTSGLTNIHGLSTALKKMRHFALRADILDFEKVARVPTFFVPLALLTGVRHWQKIAALIGIA